MSAPVNLIVKIAEAIGPISTFHDRCRIIRKLIEAPLAMLGQLQSEREETGEAWEQLAASFPTIQVDCPNQVEAAQFINQEYEKVRAERDVLRGAVCEVDGDGPCGCCIKCLHKCDDVRKELEETKFLLSVLTEERESFVNYLNTLPHEDRPVLVGPIQLARWHIERSEDNLKEVASVMETQTQELMEQLRCIIHMKTEKHENS